MPLIPIAIPVQQPRMMFFDANGKPLVGGKVYSLKIGTDIFKPTFRDTNHTALNQNPIILDEAGSALIYMTGNHLLKIYDKFDNFVEMRFLPVTQMRTYFFDKLGKPLKFGKVETYDIASTIKKASYTSSEQTVINPNPVILDENGSANICIVGSYRLRVYDESNVFLGDQDFQRPIAFALTSKPYPIYTDEDLTTSFVIDDAVLRFMQELNEELNTSFILHDAKFRDTYNLYEESPEFVGAQFAIEDAIFRSSEPQNKTYVAEVENVKTLFAIVDPIQKTPLITNTLELHSFNASFAIEDAKIKN